MMPALLHASLLLLCALPLLALPASAELRQSPTGVEYARRFQPSSNGCTLRCPPAVGSFGLCDESEVGTATFCFYEQVGTSRLACDRTRPADPVASPALTASSAATTRRLARALASRHRSARSSQTISAPSRRTDGSFRHSRASYEPGSLSRPGSGRQT